MILFKTHCWDDFIARQYARYAAQATTFVCLDDSSGRTGAIDVPHLMRFTLDDLHRIGLGPRYERGNLLWWNTDYPHYLFAQRHPGFGHALAVEYDTCCTGDIAAFVAQAQARSIDMVGLPIRTPMERWMWTRFHARTYPREALRGSLNCISLYSARALALLYRRRRDMADEAAHGRVPFWPGNEVFLPTEIARAGYRFASLAEFGAVDRYEWHPPVLEEDLPPPGPGMSFLHPVLDRPRAINSLLRFSPELTGYFRADSELRRTLARFPAEEWRPRLAAAAWARLRMRARERTEGMAARLVLRAGRTR